MPRIARLTAILTAIAALLTPPAASAQDPDNLDIPNNPNNDLLAQLGDADHAFVRFDTTAGEFTVLLDRERAPVTADHILQLVETDFYDGLIIHRVLPVRPTRLSIILGGAFLPDLSVRETDIRPDGIPNEWENGLTHLEGTIAMARRGNQPNSATTQWFINTTDNPVLDEPRDGAGYAVFGTVVQGIDTVKQISNLDATDRPTRQHSVRLRNVPQQTVTIEEASILLDDQITDQLRQSAQQWEQTASTMAADAEQRLRQEYIERAESMCARQFRGKIGRERNEAVAQNTADAAARFAQVAEQLQETGTPDDEVAVVRLAQGDGPPVQQDDVITLNMTVWNERTSAPVALLSSWARLGDAPMTSAVQDLPSRGIGRTPLEPIQALHDLITDSNVGARFVARIPSELAYGNEDLRAVNLPGRSTLIFEIEILDRLPGFQTAVDNLDDNASRTETGIDFAVIEEGQGESPALTDFTETTYAGWLTDGTRFDTNTFEFSPEGVIQGWTQSLTDMKPGEKRIVRIPANLGYGGAGAGDTIPPNATLIFYIELRDVHRFDQFLENECDAYQTALRGEDPTADANR